MGNNITVNKQKTKNRLSKILGKIEAMPDVRIGETKPLTNRYKKFFDLVSKNVTQLLFVNVLFILFLIPVLVMLLYYMPLQVDKVTKPFVQTTDFGFGLTAGGNPYVNGMEAIYNLQIKMAIYLLPCLFFGILGYSGLFFVSRNFIWDVPVKPLRHFFRGVKNNILKFIPFSIILSLLISLAIYSASMAQLKIIKSLPSSGWIFLCVITCIIGLLFVIFGEIYFPMLVSYKFNFKQRVKNTIYLIVLNIPQILLVNIIVFLPLVLAIIKFVGIIFGIVFLTIGFAVQVNIFTLLANFTFDMYIRPIYEVNKKRNLNYKKIEKKISNKNIEENESNNSNVKKPRIELISKEEENSKNQEELEKQKRKQKYIEKQKRNQKKK